MAEAIIPPPGIVRTQSGFLKELDEKGIITAIDNATAKDNLRIRNRVYHMSLDDDFVIPETIQMKIGENAEIIKLKVHKNILGSGGFGSVFRCGVKEEQGSSIKETDICLKLGLQWDERGKPDKEVNRHILREIKNFSLLKDRPHDNIIRFLFACSTTNSQVCLGLEYFRGRDLSRIINKYRQKGNRLPTDHINIILKGVVSAVIHLQALDIIHCDIKPHNVLFNCYTMKVKLIDFGCAFQCKERKTNFGGTSVYMAPEMIVKAQTPHIDSTDVYSIGALGYRLVTFRRPWDDDADVAQALEQKSRQQVSQAVQEAMKKTKEVEMDDGSKRSFTRLQMSLRNPQADHRTLYPPHCDLLCDMLDLNPAQRPTCEKIIFVIDEKCSNLATRKEHCHLAKLAKELAATHFESTEPGEMVPALPQLEGSHTLSTAFQPTEAPSSILDEDRGMHTNTRVHTRSEASQHSTSSSRSNERKTDAQPALRLERQTSNQRVGSLLEPISEVKPDEQADADDDFQPDAEDDFPLGIGLQKIETGFIAEGHTERAETAAGTPVPFNQGQHEYHDWSDVPSSEFASSFGEPNDFYSHYNDYSTSMQFLNGRFDESISFYVNEPPSNSLVSLGGAVGYVEDSSMPSVEGDEGETGNPSMENQTTQAVNNHESVHNLNVQSGEEDMFL